MEALLKPLVRNEKIHFRKLIWREVVFGMPSKDCSGSGICKIANMANPSAWRTQKRKCSSALALFTAEDGVQVTIRFCKSTMCIPTVRKHFHSDHFTMEEDVAIPAALARQLHLADPVLKKGKYPIRESELFFSVSFPI